MDSAFYALLASAKFLTRPKGIIMSALSAGRNAVLDLESDADYSLGVDEVITDGVVAPPATPTTPGVPVPSDPRDGALTTIGETIPSEGLAFYLGFYGIFLSTANGLDENIRALLATLILLGTVVVNAAFVIAPRIRKALRKRGKNRRNAVARLILRATLLSLLCLVYIAATPQNPYILFNDGLLLPGTIVAAVVAAALVLVKKLRAIIAGPPAGE